MAGRAIEGGIFSILTTLKDPLVIFSLITSWMTFSVLNRPVGEPKDEISDWVWGVNLGESIFITLWAILVILKYFM
jgi:hypothetical protein